jgi:hypothetical protein
MKVEPLNFNQKIKIQITIKKEQTGNIFLFQINDELY